MAHMTREMTFGLLLVAVLTGVFGFMVYKRMHTPADLSANTEDVVSPSTGEGAAPEGGGSDSQALGADPLEVQPVDPAVHGADNEPANNASPPIRFAAAETKPAPTWPPTGDDPFAAAAQSTNQPPVQSTAADDPFASETTAPITAAPGAAAAAREMDDPFTEPKPAAAAKPAAAPKPAANTFDPFSTAEPAVTIRPRETAAPTAAASTEPADDPFASELTPAVPETTTTARSTSPALPQETFDPLAPAESAAVESTPEADPLALPAPTQTAIDFTTMPLRAPARVLDDDVSAETPTVIEQPFGRASAAPPTTVVRLPMSSPTTTSAPLVAAGSTYVLQPQDNYWTISKKIYGAGRYAEALAKHNAATVRDPQRMQPGTPIATPSAEELETLYPDLIPDLQTATATTTIVAAADSYVTVPGDNFWTIAKKVYGHGRHFQALAEHNRATIPDPLKLQPGTSVLTPPVEVLEAREAASSTAVPVVPVRGMEGGETIVAGFFLSDDDQPLYRVASGDTLSSIARAHLGRSSRSVQILEMNRDHLKDGNTLSVGTVLRLPSDASQVQTTP
jgi:nucleoid-associated protein YgaU